MAECLRKLLEPVCELFSLFNFKQRHGILDDGLEHALVSESQTNSAAELQAIGSMLPHSTNIIGDRGLGNERPTLKDGKHCHFQRPPRTTMPFFKRKVWTYFRRNSTCYLRAYLRPPNWERELQIQSPSDIEITGGDSMTEVIQKYGRTCGVIGRGSSGVIFLSHKVQEWHPYIDRFYAIKVFLPGSPTNKTGYGSRVGAEYSISSSLRHQNVVRTFDLLQIGSGRLCTCLEYCSEGDLHSLIVAKGQLGKAESDCFFKQLIRGVDYIHEMGIAHRDLKPENLLLTSSGCLKISDFGCAECFRLAWENYIHLSRTRRGSHPYVSPEQYLNKEFDPGLVDIWAAAVIYVAMRTGRILWSIATTDDESFRDYLADRRIGRGYFLIEDIYHLTSRRIIYSMLDVDYMDRPRSNEVLRSQWLQEIETCTDADSGTVQRDNCLD